MTKTNNQRRILVVDDEAGVRALLRECFEVEGYAVVEAADSREALGALDAAPPDIVTLDLKLAGEDGLDVARQIRSKCNVPIVMITGKGDPIDRIVGLELGADDYITKPFHLREVLARIRAILRRYDPPAPAEPAAGPEVEAERFAFDSWVLDIPRRELRSSNGAVHDLTTAEFNMLEIFVRRPHRVLSRDNIMDLLKGHDWSPYDRSIDSLIVRLRRKIEPNPETPRLIKTVRGVGYVMAAETRKFDR